MAPEVILNRGHDKGADHWALGIIIFEMIEGTTPFYDDGMNQIKLFRCICEGNVAFAATIDTSPEVKDLIQKLLVVDPAQRIGSLANGINEIYTHSWFTGINFGKLRQKRVDAPWLPQVKNELDATHFESWDHLEDKSTSNALPISEEEQRIFESF
jgi:protein kinase A